MNTPSRLWMLTMTALMSIGLGGAGCTASIVPCEGAECGSSSSGMPPAPPPPPPVTKADKIDLLLMIDNSRSMADKQQILADAVPDLVRGLANPPCVDAADKPAQQQPAGPLDACPAGTKRAFTPILDIHIGVITSSLGGHGSDACSVQGDPSCGNGLNPTNNDQGHLVSRADACGGELVPTYKGSSGFLAWDPTQKLTPPGDKDLGDAMTAGIIPSLRDMVIGVGQIGCGYESQLESWYRFLVDPEPYQTISVVNGEVAPMGTDDPLLQQRADFLRPSSLLAILMLTDENDCSFKEYGDFYTGAQQRNPANPKQSFHLPRARSECAVNPNDPCCKSCAQDQGACPSDPTCSANPTLGDFEDDINLRCFDQKRRFGVDFLYPIDRYTQALTSPTVQNRAGELVPNPIFSDLDPADADSGIRAPSLVYLAGIVGVPWQLVARDPGDLTKGFKNAGELEAKDQNGDTTWDRILGNPANFVPAKDPHMIESPTPRAGLPPPGSPPNADPYNGHEYETGHRDLEYACVFDLPVPRDCAKGNTSSCDCEGGSDNPLCDPAVTTTQVRGKAYPGLRELAALRSVGDQGVVASICAAQLEDDQALDYGYRPAVTSLLDQVRQRAGSDPK